MPNHHVSEDWMGEPVETLEDLLRPGLRAVCVGINPAPASVAAGHYYQGTLGQRLFERLTEAGVIPRGDGYEDDRAFAAGLGFTDIVKRPTVSARDLRANEFGHGRELLKAKLDRFGPKLVIFSFKAPANLLFGGFHGNGFVPGLELGKSEVFVMPGPYESAETANATMAQLAARRWC